MTPKRTLDRGEGLGKVKRARKSLSLETKPDILKRNEFGEGSSAISRSLNLPQSTVATVLRNASSIKEAAANASSLQVKLLTKHREPIMDRQPNTPACQSRSQSPIPPHFYPTCFLYICCV